LNESSAISAKRKSNITNQPNQQGARNRTNQWMKLQPVPTFSSQNDQNVARRRLSKCT